MNARNESLLEQVNRVGIEWELINDEYELEKEREKRTRKKKHVDKRNSRIKRLL